jgi:hypothetical protein
MANPWHDEIGRFAPKGEGSNAGPGSGGDVGITPEYKGKLRGALHKFMDWFMDGLDDNSIEDSHWDPIGLVPYAAQHKALFAALIDSLVAEVKAAQPAQFTARDSARLDRWATQIKRHVTS